MYVYVWGFVLGTTANVSVNLFGVKNDIDNADDISTGPRLLIRPGAFKRGGVDSFVVASDRSLGIVNRVRVWHDNTGSNPDWFLARLVIRDLQSNSCRHFIANRWLTLTGLEDGGAEIETELSSPG